MPPMVQTNIDLDGLDDELKALPFKGTTGIEFRTPTGGVLIGSLRITRQAGDVFQVEGFSAKETPLRALDAELYSAWSVARWVKSCREFLDYITSGAGGIT